MEFQEIKQKYKGIHNLSLKLPAGTFTHELDEVGSPTPLALMSAPDLPPTGISRLTIFRVDEKGCRSIEEISEGTAEDINELLTTFQTGE